VHVLAAAIAGHPDCIVTANLKDFPEDALAPFGIQVVHPDDFLIAQMDLDSLSVLAGRYGAGVEPALGPQSISCIYVIQLRSCRLKLQLAVSKLGIHIKDCNFDSLHRICMPKFTVRTAAQLPPLLQAFRKKVGLTQSEVALRLGVSQQTYSAMERNADKVGTARLLKLLNILGVELALGTPSPGPNPTSGPSGQPSTDKPVW
jgi:HTH-type transcriptional regulator / antitoxin HipB